MTHRLALLLFPLFLAGCIDEAGVDAIFCDPDEPCWEERGLDGAGGEVCPVGPLGYDPTRTDVTLKPMGNGVSGVLVALPAFDAPTSCQTIVVGIGVSANCKLPVQGFTLTVFDSNGVPTSIPSSSLLTNVSPQKLSDIMPGVTEARFPYVTKHKAGARPVIGFFGGPVTCPVSFDTTCDGTSSFSVDPDAHLTEQEGVGYWIGMEDCSTN